MSGQRQPAVTEAFVGIDVGTSGMRALAIDAAGILLGEARSETSQSGGEQDPLRWRDELLRLLDRLFDELPAATAVVAMSLDGTSGTVLLTDSAGRPLGPALMYHDQRAVAEAERIAGCAAAESAARGAGSGLAKLLWLRQRYGEGKGQSQANWLLSQLAGEPLPCDSNNALKMGFDPVGDYWPGWIETLPLGRHCLPTVVTAGTPVSYLDRALCRRWRLEQRPQLVAGTTDSTAATIASGASAPGDGITALGSTLVVKVISNEPLFALDRGIYSQPFGSRWLIGGASNSGGAVLRQLFTDDQIAALTRRLEPDQPTGLNFYPLPRRGERFPLNDPNFAPRIEPRPSDDRLFFQGLLEGMARIEAEGYRLLATLGAPYPTNIRTTGGGATNEGWRRIRERELGIPVCAARHQDAAYGSALLARDGYRNQLRKE